MSETLSEFLYRGSSECEAGPGSVVSAFTKPQDANIFLTCEIIGARHKRCRYGAGRLATTTFVQGPGSGEIGGGKNYIIFTDARMQ